MSELAVLDVEAVIEPAVDAVRIEKRMTVSEWADAYRFLSSEASAEVGKWHTERAAYQRGIMDALTEAKVRRVVVMSSAQIGKTEIILNALAYYADHSPSPSMVLQPTLEMARAFSVDRFAPMVRDCERLDAKVVSYSARSGESTILHRSFVGGHVTFVGANSPAGLAGRPIRFLAADEADRYPLSAKSEGNPLELARKRTTTYFNAKELVTSTPTVKGASVIEREYEAGSMATYHVPCPHCGALQQLTWAGISWQRDASGAHLPDTAVYKCAHCRAEIDHKHKNAMVRKGIWVHAHPEREEVRSFHLSELYSPWSSWAKMVTEFLKAKRDPQSLRVFVNTSLGETWEEADSMQISAQNLIDALEDYEQLPDGVLLLTCGVDVQDTYMVADVWGWGKDEEAWLVERKVILGTPSNPEAWAELERFLAKQYTHEYEKLPAQMVVSTCIDTGGHFTEDVYMFCKRHERSRVFAVKGQAGAQPIAPRTFSIRGKVRAKLFMVGVDTAKEVIYSRLAWGGRVHLPKRFADADYMQELTAEKQVKKFSHGRITMSWQKIRPRNEALDCAAYAMAAMKMLNPAWEVLEKRHRLHFPADGRILTVEGEHNPQGQSAPKETKTQEAAAQDAGSVQTDTEPAKEKPATQGKQTPAQLALQAHLRKVRGR